MMTIPGVQSQSGNEQPQTANAEKQPSEKTASPLPRMSKQVCSPDAEQIQDPAYSDKTGAGTAKQITASQAFDWKNWDIGGRVIFVSACVSVASMLMTWVDVGIVSQTGLSQQAFFYLGFFVYPVLTLFKKTHMNKAWGLVCGAGGIISAIVYIASKTVDVLGETINVAASGAYVFLFASVALTVGIAKYRPLVMATNKIEQTGEIAGQ
jgi:hypothetical protein